MSTLPSNTQRGRRPALRGLPTEAHPIEHPLGQRMDQPVEHPIENTALAAAPDATTRPHLVAVDDRAQLVPLVLVTEPEDGQVDQLLTGMLEEALEGTVSRAVTDELAASVGSLLEGSEGRLCLVVARVEQAPPAPPPERLLEPLTGKELEVLGHLDGLLSTEEIAAQMYVSVNTVRTHVRSILRKLDVNRRNNAVRRARALGLLPR